MPAVRTTLVCLILMTAMLSRSLQAQVPQPYQRQLTADSLSLLEDETMITLSSHNRTVLVYNKTSPTVPDGMNPLYHRSGFLHPVMSPAGQVVTATFPADHPHQHGIFSAWVKTSWNNREIDFWNLLGGTGRVLHQRVVNTSIDGSAISFEVDLVHRAEQEPVVDILRERWTITALPTDGTYHAFDLQTVQHASTDLPLLLHKYHYGGIALRGPTRWLTGKDSDATSETSPPREPTAFVNHLGSDRIVGNHQHTNWVALTGELGGRPATIAVLCHVNNPRAPQAARIHPTKPYFVFSPCVDGPLTIDRDHPYRASYRYLVTDAPPDADWLNAQWQAWVEGP